MSSDIMFEGLRLRNVHPWEQCQGLRLKPCVIHNPSPHHMRLWRLSWRDDRQIFERICPHGIGHPDPDQLDYWKNIGQEWQSVHGCDGCCSAPVLDYRPLWKGK